MGRHSEAATENWTGAFILLFAGGVQLFEILQDGFHTPLTEAQISQLFQAGRLNRHTPCKPVKQAAWRTIDELFPLLKYNAPWRLTYRSAEPSSEFRFRRAIVVAASLIVSASAALTLCFYSQGESSGNRRITAIDSISSSTGPSNVRRAPVITTQPIPNTVSVPAEQAQTQAAIRLAEAQRINEQARRDQALAEQQRTLHERMLLEQ